MPRKGSHFNNHWSLRYSQQEIQNMDKKNTDGELLQPCTRSLLVRNS